MSSKPRNEWFLPVWPEFTVIYAVIPQGQATREMY